MKTFITDLIPKIQRFSQRLDDLSKLTNQHWVSLSEIPQSKIVFIFRSNNQLLISENGIVKKGTWEYLGNHSLLIDTMTESFLLKQGFFDENILALKLDSTESYAIFINETKYDGELKTIDDVLIFLENKYLKDNNIPNDSSFTKNGASYNNKEYGYVVTSKKELKNLFGAKLIKYEIQFSDKSKGIIYQDLKSQQFYFEDWFGDHIWNSDFHKTVTDMYAYNRTKKH